MDGLMRTALSRALIISTLKFSKGRVLSMFKAMSPFRMRMFTLDYALNQCVITGSVNKVVDQILDLHEKSGASAS